MALNFPGSPTNGQTHVENGITYYWDAAISAWLVQVPTVPIAVGNTISSNGYYTNRATVTGGINLIEGTGITINVDPDPTVNKANITITSTGGDTTIAEAAFDRANSVWDSANSNYTFTANTVRLIANSAYDKANTNYTYAANNVMGAANSAYAAQNTTYTFAANTVRLIANTAYDKANSNYTYAANNVMLAANAAFAQANAANLIPVGNTISSNSYYTNRTTRRGINFLEGAGITINVDDDPTLNLSNITITSTGGDTTIAEAAFDQANTVWNSANSNYTFAANTVRLIANSAYAAQNTTYTYAANNVMRAANAAYAAQNTTYTFAANTVRLIANSAYGKANTTYTYAANDVMRTANAAYNYANTVNSTTIAYIIDGGGSAISGGVKGTIEIPFDFQIMRWTILADQAGTANIDMWSRDYSTTLPTVANSVTGNIGITLSSATANQSTAIDNWRMTTINKDNVITYNVVSSSTITRATISLFGYKV